MRARTREAVSRIAMADAKRGWPADHVERWPIDRLIPFAKNARTHTPAQIAQLAEGWPADHVERWPIDRLIPFAKNARTHTRGPGGAPEASLRPLPIERERAAR
jgi:hypothetical protein